MSTRPTPRRMPAGQARAWLCATLIAASAGVACTDAGRVAILPAPVTISDARSRIDSVAAGFFEAHESHAGLVPRAASMSSGPSATTSSVVSVTPSWFQGPGQHQPITAVLTGPVNSVTVSGMGAILCSGTFGTLIAYDANGAVLASAPLTLIYQPDCGYDDVTFGATATVTVTQGVIASFKILPMSPFEFPVNGVPGGHGSATYSVSLGEYPPAVDAPPTASFTASCAPYTYSCSFDASASTDDVGIVSYAWDLGNPPNSVASGVFVSSTYPAGGQYTVKLTVTDAKGQSSTSIKTIQVGLAPGTPPIPSLSWICNYPGCWIDSQGSLGSSVLVRSWDFGDGTTAGDIVTLTHNFPARGFYAVTMKVTDKLGLTGVIGVAMNVGAATFGNGLWTSEDCASVAGSCTLGVSASGGTAPYTYSWRFGDGTTAGNLTTVTHSYAAAGTYVVMVTATDAAGLQSAAAWALRQNAPPADASPVARFTVNCTGQTYPHQCAFDASTSSDDKGIASYKWDWGNGRTETKVGSSARNTWATAGNYNVTLTVTDTKGQQHAITKLVTVP
jgi:PKD repeat protein